VAKAGTSKTRADLIQFRAIWTTVDHRRNGLGTAHFFFGRRVVFTLKERVTRGATLGQLLEATIPPMGYDLVDWELQPRARLVRVFIDKRGHPDEGVTVEDCARVSNHLTRAFAVEGVDYERLEVSSPGLDRPLKRIEDYARFAGQKASLRLKLPRDGRRRFEGTLAGVDAGSVVLEVEGARMAFAFGDIDRARLVPDV